ncbi:MAG: QueT transporter family protein [Christensenellales bacterium]
MKKFSTRMLARAGIIAAMYVALTFLVFPVASGAIQFRISEALTILPLFYVEAIPALFVGCLLSNIITGCVIADVIVGSLITLVSSLLTYLVGRYIKSTALKIILGGLPPVLLNAFFLPLIWYFAYGSLEYVYMMQVLFLIISQGVVIYLLGTAVYFAVARLCAKGIKVFMTTGVETNNKAPDTDDKA